MRISAVISLFAFSVAAFPGDLTWTSLLTVDSASPLSTLPPSTTIIQTVSGNQTAVRMGDNVTIMDGESVVIVDYLKREYFRQSIRDFLAKRDAAQRAVKYMPEYGDFMIHAKETPADRPGPTIAGIPTTLRSAGVMTEIKVGPLAMAMDIDMEMAYGKPDGWEAVTAAQQSHASNANGILKALEAIVGAYEMKQLRMQSTMDGMPMRTRMVMKMNMNIQRANPALPAPPPLSPMETTVTMEVTSISKIADPTLLAVPDGYREVLPPSPFPVASPAQIRAAQ